MTSKPPSPWDQAAIRSADTRKRENVDRRQEVAAGRDEAFVPRRDAGNRHELRYYGLNAVQAVFAHRPDAIRKVYLLESRIPQLQPLLAWCVKQRIGYRVVEEADLGKLAASSHHEGVVADVLRAEPQSLADWLQSLPPGRCFTGLDGVGNNTLRRDPRRRALRVWPSSSGRFDAAAMAPPEAWPGRPEHVPLDACRNAGLPGCAARSGLPLAAPVGAAARSFSTGLPHRLVYCGAEGEGMDHDLVRTFDLICPYLFGAVEASTSRRHRRFLAWRHPPFVRPGLPGCSASRPPGPRATETTGNHLPAAASATSALFTLPKSPSASAARYANTA